MARMSIDDSFGRDPRVRRLAKLSGWSRRETMGTLLDIFALCYDRTNEYLPEADIIEVAGQDGLDCLGFVEKMITVGLGTRFRSVMIRVSGAEERINYLRKQSRLGRAGGLKSGRSRKKEPKGQLSVRFDDPQGCTNPPDPVPDPVSAPVPIPDPVPVSAPSLFPEQPTERPRLQVVRDERSFEIERIISAVFPEHLRLYNEIRSEFKIEVPAMAAVGAPAERELKDLLHAMPSLVGALERCRHALTVRAACARAERSLQYFGVTVWKQIPFDRAQDMQLHERADPRATRGSVFDAIDDALHEANSALKEPG